jgi:hypothetical protein
VVVFALDSLKWPNSKPLAHSVSISLRLLLSTALHRELILSMSTDNTFAFALSLSCSTMANAGNSAFFSTGAFPTGGQQSCFSQPSSRDEGGGGSRARQEGGDGGGCCRGGGGCGQEAHASLPKGSRFRSGIQKTVSASTVASLSPRGFQFKSIFGPHENCRFSSIRVEEALSDRAMEEEILPVCITLHFSSLHR